MIFLWVTGQTSQMISGDKAHMLKAFMTASRYWRGRSLRLATLVRRYRRFENLSKVSSVALVAFFLLIGLSMWNASAHGAGTPKLNHTLKAIIKEVLPSDYTAGVQVADLDTGTILMEYNPNTALIPASTMKVITTSAALRILNPEFTFITEVLGTDLKGQSVGNLYMRGTGDPYLVSERLFALATEVVARGVKEIRGNIIVDDSYLVPAIWPFSRRWRRALAQFQFHQAYCMARC